MAALLSFCGLSEGLSLHFSYHFSLLIKKRKEKKEIDSLILHFYWNTYSDFLVCRCIAWNWFFVAPKAERFPLEVGVAWYFHGRGLSWRTIMMMMMIVRRRTLPKLFGGTPWPLCCSSFCSLSEGLSLHFSYHFSLLIQKIQEKKEIDSLILRCYWNTYSDFLVCRCIAWNWLSL